MAFLRIPSAATPVSFATLLASTAGFESEEPFRRALQERLGVPWVGLTGSGTAALYSILRVLSRRSVRTKVLLPAYTAPSLVLPIRRAGLTPALADVSLDTLNSDAPELLGRVDGDTLAVMPVHMFGLAADVRPLTASLSGSGAFSVEDACSALGTELDGKPAGTLCDVGFHSFNRGKNLSTLSGGAVSTADGDLAAELETDLLTFPTPGLGSRVRAVVLAGALAGAVRPLFYTALYPVVSRFKYTQLHTDFSVARYTPFRARLGRRILSWFPGIAAARRENASYLRGALEGLPGLRLPRVLEGSIPVLNQFPILLPDAGLRDRAHRAVVATGLEATVLYPDPIHRIYRALWDGAGPDPFPNATEVSRRLVLLPVHPLVPRKALARAVDALARAIVPSSIRKEPAVRECSP